MSVKDVSKLIKDKENYQFQLMSLLDVEKLEKQFEDVSKAYDLNLKIDRSVLKNVVDKIKQSSAPSIPSSIPLLRLH